MPPFFELKYNSIYFEYFFGDCLSFLLVIHYRTGYALMVFKSIFREILRVIINSGKGRASFSNLSI